MTPMTAPVPWSLAWRENGELAPQDRFDLLQTLVANEAAEVQTEMISAVERTTLLDITVVAEVEVTRLYS
jgi:hypothetical protein